MYLVALDFDGVIHAHTHTYHRPDHIPDSPTTGALQAVLAYRAAGFEVVVHTTRAKDPRGAEAVAAWLLAHGFPSDIRVTATKPAATIYVDDRGLRFTGSNWPTVQDVLCFRPWNRN
ncbi:MAG TPA: hypothetical protein VM487_06155 [Phycisphaerae bacterium]|nr:hypothetical protein [Phycisphaerae bacterium]